MLVVESNIQTIILNWLIIYFNYPIFLNNPIRRIKNYYSISRNLTSQEQKILTSEECDAIWDHNVLQWLFGDNKKKKQDLIDYCAVDTSVMIDIWKTLIKL